MKTILFCIVIVYNILNAFAFNNSTFDLSSILGGGSDQNGKTSTGLCALHLLKYVDCYSNLSKATKGRDLTTIDSSEICPIFESKCKDFISDTYDNIDCDNEYGVLTKYATTLNRLYYLSFCVKDTEGNNCPVTNIIKGEQQLTASNSKEVFEDSCKDDNCNKSFVAMTEIIDKNIDNSLLYDQFIGFTNNLSYKAIAKSFRDGKCDSIDFITSNREIFRDIVSI